LSAVNFARMSVSGFTDTVDHDQRILSITINARAINFRIRGLLRARALDAETRRRGEASPSAVLKVRGATQTSFG
jgi:hypothetical protein